MASSLRYEVLMLAVGMLCVTASLVSPQIVFPDEIPPPRLKPNAPPSRQPNAQVSPTISGVPGLPSGTAVRVGAPQLDGSTAHVSGGALVSTELFGANLKRPGATTGAGAAALFFPREEVLPQVTTYIKYRVI